MRLIYSTPSARGDLCGIDVWLEREASAETAVATLVAIRERADFRERFPHGGRPHRDGTRILRVHHEREDWISSTP